MTGESARDLAAVARLGNGLRKALAVETLLVKLSEEGMLLLEDDAEPRRIRARAREVFDVTGAGDTVLATLLKTFRADKLSGKDTGLLMDKGLLYTFVVAVLIIVLGFISSIVQQQAAAPVLAPKRHRRHLVVAWAVPAAATAAGKPHEALAFGCTSQRAINRTSVHQDANLLFHQSLLGMAPRSPL